MTIYTFSRCITILITIALLTGCGNTTEISVIKNSLKKHDKVVYVNAHPRSSNVRKVEHFLATKAIGEKDSITLLIRYEDDLIQFPDEKLSMKNVSPVVPADHWALFSKNASAPSTKGHLIKNFDALEQAFTRESKDLHVNQRLFFIENKPIEDTYLRFLKPNPRSNQTRTLAVIFFFRVFAACVKVEI